MFGGLQPGGVHPHQHRHGALTSSAWASSWQGFRHERLLTVPAGELAREHAGRPVANAALLGGFAALSGLVSLDAVVKAIRERFTGKVGEGNVAAAMAAYAWVADERGS